MFKEDVSGPRALSSSEIGLTVGPNRQQLVAVLRDPHYCMAECRNEHQLSYS